MDNEIRGRLKRIFKRPLFGYLLKGSTISRKLRYWPISTRAAAPKSSPFLRLALEDSSVTKGIAKLSISIAITTLPYPLLKSV